MTGKITIGDQPLPYAAVRFSPQGEKQAGTSLGLTNEHGQYTLAYNRDQIGAVLGLHHVTVESSNLKELDPTRRERLVKAGSDPTKIPQSHSKYLNPGVLTAEVKAGQNTIDFQLEPQKR